MSGNGYRAGLVWIPALMGPYEAMISPEVHKGWAIPYFTLEVVEHIAADTARLVAENPDDSLVEIVNGQVRLIWMPGTPMEEVEVIEPDENGLYAVGGGLWVWEEV